VKSYELFSAISDLAGQARCCSSLSYTYSKLDDLDEAGRWAERALELSQQIGDQLMEGISHLALGRLYMLQGEHESAQHSFDLAIGLAQKAGNLRSLAIRLQVAGQSNISVGRYAEALPLLEESLEIFSQIGDGNAQAENLRNLATINLTTGQLSTATTQAEAGLRLARSYNNQQREGQLLTTLGEVYAARGDHSRARSLWQQAAAILHPVSPNEEAIALQLLSTIGAVDK